VNRDTADDEKKSEMNIQQGTERGQGFSKGTFKAQGYKK
jgi:hypothetical protein